jgi:polysaccharide deacetylase family protein (PEP-CTERM system associated)
VRFFNIKVPVIMSGSETMQPAPRASDTPSDPRTRDSHGPRPSSVPLALSFDVEEHHRIEAAAGLEVAPEAQQTYRERMRHATEWLLEQLGDQGILATFFIVGEIAETDPGLVQSIHKAGHEVASHGWDHRRIHAMNPESFREDVRTSMDRLQQVTGAAVLGYRAPTFSLVRKTSWALDVLSELGLLYDSSIYPVRHDRYGIPDAPRGPFLARGNEGELLEIPPASLRAGGVNLPVGGGGYFRLLPSLVMRMALSLSRRDPEHRASVLYFHPWEFDADQPRLPLPRLSRYRTYLGIAHSRNRLRRLLTGYPFVRMADLAHRLLEVRESLPQFSVVS